MDDDDEDAPSRLVDRAAQRPANVLHSSHPIQPAGQIMIVIAGAVIVLVSVLVGFIGSGGHVHALIHPFELVTIGGCALGRRS
jgi:hypothetical protein